MRDGDGDEASAVEVEEGWEGGFGGGRGEEGGGEEAVDGHGGVVGEGRGVGSVRYAVGEGDGGDGGGDGAEEAVQEGAAGCDVVDGGLGDFCELSGDGGEGSGKFGVVGERHFGEVGGCCEAVVWSVDLRDNESKRRNRVE